MQPTTILAVMWALAASDTLACKDPKVVASTLPAAKGEAKKSLVLKYEDFGPQVAAHELIGMQWCPWAAPCGASGERDAYVKAHPKPADAPADACDIRVVVYRNTTLAAVKKKFPAVPYQVDYRYVSYDAALKGLEVEATKARIKKDLGN